MGEGRAIRRLTVGGDPEKPPEHDSITVMPGGPLYVRGLVELRTSDGSVIVEDARLALCRCGQSQNKPFCDNTHLGVAFDDLGSAPETEAKHHANGK
jgi:CDGSH-type Zn-finger protein